MKSILNYQNYRSLSKKQKQKRIEQAVQHQKDRGPNPQGECIFDQLKWLDFKVIEKNKEIKLCTYRHQCINEPKALVIMLHGLNSHIGHGAHIAHHFAKHGIITVGFDHRGFGRSQGEAGYAQSLQTHIEDSLSFTKLIRQVYPTLPLFCLGLSMGGMTTYYLTLKHKKLFQGAIMMAPAIKNNIGGFLLGFAKTITSILPKKMKLMKPIYGKATRNPKITQDIKQDQFSFSQRARLSTIQMLLKTMDQTPKTFHLYNCPFVIVQGGLDKLVNPEGAFELYDQSATKEEDKELLFYEGMWHDVWHQPEINEITQKITHWILKRLKIKAKDLNQQHNNFNLSIKTNQTKSQQASLETKQHQVSEQISQSKSQQQRLQQKLHDLQQQLKKEQNQKYDAIREKSQNQNNFNVQEIKNE